MSEITAGVFLTNLFGTAVSTVTTGQGGAQRTLPTR